MALPNQPAPQGQPSPDEMKGQMVQVLRAMKDSAEQAGIDFDEVLALASGGGGQPSGLPNVSAPPAPAGQPAPTQPQAQPRPALPNIRK